jgi:hypothetical protein
MKISEILVFDKDENSETFPGEFFVILPWNESNVYKDELIRIFVF